MKRKTREIMFDQVQEYLISIPDPHGLEDLPMNNDNWDVPIQYLVIKHKHQLPTFIAA